MPRALRKVGSYSGKNNTRDFERALKLPLVSRGNKKHFLFYEFVDFVLLFMVHSVMNFRYSYVRKCMGLVNSVVSHVRYSCPIFSHLPGA